MVEAVPTIAVRLVKPYRLPGGSFVHPDEVLGFSPSEARALIASGVGVAVDLAVETPDAKAPAQPPVDKMLPHASRKTREVLTK